MKTDNIILNIRLMNIILSIILDMLISIANTQKLFALVDNQDKVELFYNVQDIYFDYNRMCNYLLNEQTIQNANNPDIQNDDNYEEYEYEFPAFMDKFEMDDNNYLYSIFGNIYFIRFFIRNLDKSYRKKYKKPLLTCDNYPLYMCHENKYINDFVYKLFLDSRIDIGHIDEFGSCKIITFNSNISEIYNDITKPIENKFNLFEFLIKDALDEYKQNMRNRHNP